MIELYRPLTCETCAEIEAALKEMVIAHKVITVGPDEAATVLGVGVSLPAFKENERVISGRTNIAAYLRELEGFMRRWQKYQSDSCYCDE